MVNIHLIDYLLRRKDKRPVTIITHSEINKYWLELYTFLLDIPANIIFQRLVRSKKDCHYWKGISYLSRKRTPID